MMTLKYFDHIFSLKPEDWDDEMDGEWEPPMIDNPEYKGEWKPRQVRKFPKCKWYLRFEPSLYLAFFRLITQHTKESGFIP